MTMRTERTAVVGVFENRTEAERAMDELKRAGFRQDQLGFAMRGEEAGAGTTEEGETKTGEGAAGGALAGAGIGAILGALATGLIPGVGPFIAAGLLAGIAGGAAAGAVAGGLIGALTGMGVPEEEARYYDQEFQAGRAIVTVKADGRVQEADTILHRYGAYDVEHERGTGGPAGTTRAEGERTVQLREEELLARKQTREAGEVGIRKDVVTEQRTVEVPVSREEVTVERHPVDRKPADHPIDEGETIRVPVREEEVQVEKRPVVTEEVSIGKRQVQDTERVSGEVRREEARIEGEGDVDVRGSDVERRPRGDR